MDFDKAKELKAIGELIDELRKAKGLSYLDLSYLTGIDRSNLSKFIQGKSDITVTSLMRILKALDVDLKERL